jgi:hypothetical protein
MVLYKLLKIEGRLHSTITEFEKKIDRKFENMDQNFEKKIDQKFENMDKKIEKVSEVVNSIAKKLGVNQSEDKIASNVSEFA